MEKIEDLHFEGKEPDGTLVFSSEKETSIEILDPRIKNLIEEIETKELWSGWILMIKREVNHLIGEGVSKDVIINSIQDKLIEKYKKEIESINNSSSGEAVKDSFKTHLIEIGIDKHKL